MYIYLIPDLLKKAAGNAKSPIRLDIPKLGSWCVDVRDAY